MIFHLVSRFVHSISFFFFPIQEMWSIQWYQSHYANYYRILFWNTCSGSHFVYLQWLCVSDLPDLSFTPELISWQFYFQIEFWARPKFFVSFRSITFSNSSEKDKQFIYIFNIHGKPHLFFSSIIQERWELRTTNNIHFRVCLLVEYILWANLHLMNKLNYNGHVNGNFCANTCLLIIMIRFCVNKII